MKGGEDDEDREGADGGQVEAFPKAEALEAEVDVRNEAGPDQEGYPAVVKPPHHPADPPPGQARHRVAGGADEQADDARHQVELHRPSLGLPIWPHPLRKPLHGNAARNFPRIGRCRERERNEEGASE